MSMTMKDIDEECRVCNDTMVRMYTQKTKVEDMLKSLACSTPDMMWHKDIEGKYLWVNSRLVSGLLFSGTVSNTLGKTDIEIASAHRRKDGSSHHTVGAVCADSDKIVLRYEKPMRFIEEFVVDGQPLVLEVHKNVVRDGLGKVVGTVGIGRDITYEFTKLRDLSNDETLLGKHREVIKDIIERNYIKG